MELKGFILWVRVWGSGFGPEHGFKVQGLGYYGLRVECMTV